jgi:hypothetical protein
VSLDQLERFERDTARAVEAAFHLAHNAGISRFLLDATRAPDTDEVAFALDDPEDGPFLISRRDGTPIRCVKRGARPRLHIVTRAMLESAAKPHETVRAIVSRWSHQSPVEQGFRATFRRLFEAGDRVSREDLKTISPFLPIFGERLPALWYACDDVIRDFVKRAGDRLLAERDRLDARSMEQVRRTWRMHWAVGHLQALFAQVDDDQLRQTAATVIQGAAPLRAMRFGFWPVALRGLSLCGRLGPTLFTGLERGLKLPPDAIHESLPSAHGLGFVGAAHPKLRAQTQALLQAVQSFGDARSEWLFHESQLLSEALHELVADEKELAPRLLEHLIALTHRDIDEPVPEVVLGPPPEDPHDFFVSLANAGLDHHGRFGHTLLRYALGVFARTPIEDLYRTSRETQDLPEADPLARGLEFLSVAVRHLARLKGERRSH